MDFTTELCQKKVKEVLEGREVDAVISDMAPAASGIRSLDNENMLKLCYAALAFAVQMSRVGATFLVKLWQCGESKKLEEDLGKFYRNVRWVKPKSSRSDSAEVFCLGRDFRGLKT